VPVSLRLLLERTGGACRSSEAGVPQRPAGFPRPDVGSGAAQIRAGREVGAPLVNAGLMSA
jgi:hypothetical protein